MYICSRKTGDLGISDLRQISGFLWEFQFPPPIKLTTTISSRRNENLNLLIGIKFLNLFFIVLNKN
jgi:hypothetical protein